MSLDAKTRDEVSHSLYSDIQAEIPVYENAGITYKRDGKSLKSVSLEAPAVDSVATKPEKWGFFQFPNFYRSIDGSALVATQNMAADAVTSYGKGGNGLAVSCDGGKSWD